MQGWRFGTVALLVVLAAGCATAINDLLGEKANGLAQSYPLPPDRAWQIAHAVLEEMKAVAVEEHQPDGYVIADTPPFLWGLPTRIVVWIDPEGAGSRVTILCRLLRPGPLPRTVTEEEFHQAFARRVTQLAHVLGEQPRHHGPARGEAGIDLWATGGTRTPRDDLLVGLPGRANCYHVATRTPGTRRIQEDIQLGRGAHFAYDWIALGTLSTWIGTVRNPYVQGDFDPTINSPGMSVDTVDGQRLG